MVLPAIGRRSCRKTVGSMAELVLVLTSYSKGIAAASNLSRNQNAMR